MSGGLSPRLLKFVEEDWLRILFGRPSRGTQLLVYLRLNTAPPGESCLLPSGQLPEGHTGNSEGGMRYSLGQPDEPSQLNPGNRRETDSAAGSPSRLHFRFLRE